MMIRRKNLEKKISNKEKDLCQNYLRKWPETLKLTRKNQISQTNLHAPKLMSKD